MSKLMKKFGSSARELTDGDTESVIVQYQLENINELAQPEESEGGDFKSEKDQLLQNALSKNAEYQKELRSLKKIIEM